MKFSLLYIYNKYSINSLNLKKQNPVSAKKITPLRGMHDLFGHEIETYNKIIDTAKLVTQSYGYQIIQTPILENSEIFLRTLGETSDIIGKETYTFSDREKRSLTMRPEFTAAMVRAFISNGWTQSLPQKLFSYGPLFRHERPQKNRYRQFHQFNCEFFGAKTYHSDVEMISMAHSILAKLRIADHVSLQLNTLGDEKTREDHRRALVEYLEKHQNNLSLLSRERMMRNPLRVLDSKEECDQEVVKNSPNILDYLTPEAAQYHNNILKSLEKLQIPFKVNSKIVRGLDYYTSTIFEYTSDITNQMAVMAGGRYDNLVANMGGGNVRAIGLGAGIERLIYIMHSLEEQKAKSRAGIYLVSMDDSCASMLMQLAYNLRYGGILTYLDYLDNGTQIKKAVEKADKIAARYLLVLGLDELNSGQYIVKDMNNGQGKKGKIKEIENDLKTLYNLS